MPDALRVTQHANRCCVHRCAFGVGDSCPVMDGECAGQRCACVVPVPSKAPLDKPPPAASRSQKHRGGCFTLAGMNAQRSAKRQGKLPR